MPRKPRGDSILKTLPQERQDCIAEHASSHTLRETRAWLFKDGIETSIAALSDFCSWYAMRKRFDRHNHDTIQLIELLRRRNPDMPQGELDEFANQYFQLEAIKSEDPETYLAIMTARHKARMDEIRADQKERALKLDERRLELLEKKAAQADEVKAALNSEESVETIMQKTRAIFGM